MAEQPAQQKLAESFFYPAENFSLKRTNTSQIHPSHVSLAYCYGFESNKRSNIHFVNEHTVISAVGNVLVFLNLKTLEQQYFSGVREGSIGAIAVHPSRKYIAVAEIHEDGPNIYILEYPSLKVYRILREGTTRIYSDLCFNKSGEALASVGGDPDYMLTVWNWKDEKVVLRSKAFSQDVYRVAFSPENDSQLVTSGMGHIKFWTMSSTFTGLKLQGYIGKFGASELSDISAFTQFADGKVLSSTETGNLLLWDGGSIKCEIANKGKKPCHMGKVEVVLMEEGEIYTAGEDGFLRIWDYETIDSADVTSPVSAKPAASTDASGNKENADGKGETLNAATTPRVSEMSPSDEMLIGKDVKVKNMVKVPGTESEYILQDAAGNLFRVDPKKRVNEKVFSFHSGAIAAIEPNPNNHMVASIGQDGSIRISDLYTKLTVGKLNLSASGTCLTYLPNTLDVKGSAIAAGFSDGVVRIAVHTPLSTHKASTAETQFTLTHVFKPHNKPITAIAISPNGRYMVTASTDNTIFFFQIKKSGRDEDFSENGAGLSSNKVSADTLRLVPLGFVSTSAVVTSLGFSPDNHENDYEITDGDSKYHTLTMDSDEDSQMEAEYARSLATRLVAVLKNGQVYTLVAPNPKDVDTNTTFELNAEKVRMRQWELKENESQVKQLRKKAIDEFKKQKEKERVEKERVAEQSGEKQASNDQQPAEPEKPIEEQIDLTKFNQSWSIQSIHYMRGGHALLAVTNKTGDNEIRAIRFDRPGRSRLLFKYSAPFTYLRVSATEKYILAGTADGSVLMRKLDLKETYLRNWTEGHELTLQDGLDNTKIGAKQAIASAPITETTGGVFYLTHLHNSICGRVTCVASTYDDTYVCSVGEDGGFFALKVQYENPQQDAVFETSEEETLAQAHDITDAATYSIQDAKIKSAKDTELSSAEKKKQNVRDLIQQIRSEFLSLVNENQKALDDVRVPRDTFTVDPGLCEDIAKEETEKISTVRKEFQWISEKESIGPNKLKRKFLDVIQTERIRINAFKTNRFVTTFRTHKLDSAVQAALQPNVSKSGEGHTPYSRQNADREQFTRDGMTTATKASGDKEAPLNESQQTSGTKDTKPKTAIKPTDMKSKLEARKQARAERVALWKELMDSKPDDKYEDPRDIAAIRHAEANMGDYKLKTDPKYVVPEHDRVDAEKKKKQLLLLTQSIYLLKEEFNTHVLTLRDRKQGLVDMVKTYNSILDDIAQELESLNETVDNTKWQPSMEASAFSDNRFKVTDQDIKELQRQEAEEAQKARSAGDDISANFAAKAPAVAPAPAPAPIASSTPSPPSTTASRKTDGTPNQEGKSSSLEPERSPAKTELELTEQEIRRKELLYRRKSIQKLIESSIHDFDVTVDMLSKEKILLEGDLKSAEMKVLLLYREWVLLKEFEKFDNTLAQRLTEKFKEKEDIDTKVRECQDKLNAKKVEIEAVIAKEKQVLDEFHKSLGENNKHEEYLTKVFKRKIKRSKKKQKDAKNSRGTGRIGTAGSQSSSNQHEDQSDALMESTNDGEEDYESESESESDFSDFEDGEMASDDGDNAFEEIIPNDCDPALWNRVLEMRELRLDQEDVLADIQKAIDVIKKENDGLLKKEKIIDASLKATESDIQDFQTQKQKKLNELDVVVPLRLHQIQYLDAAGQVVPSDLSSALVFLNEGLKRLKLRIGELDEEKIDIRKQHKEMKKAHVNFIRSKKEKQEKLQELEGKVQDVQMLKFGRIVDIEKLEKMGINKTAEELKDKLSREDKKRAKEFAEWDKKIEQLKDDLITVTKDNTEKLEKIVNFSEQKRSFETSLDEGQSSISADYSQPSQRTLEEKRQIQQLVLSQKHEIEKLKAEIEDLIRKPMREFPIKFQYRSKLGDYLNLPAGVLPTPGHKKAVLPAIHQHKQAPSAAATTHVDGDLAEDKKFEAFIGAGPEPSQHPRKQSHRPQSSTRPHHHHIYHSPASIEPLNDDLPQQPLVVQNVQEKGGVNN